MADPDVWLGNGQMTEVVLEVLDVGFGKALDFKNNFYDRLTEHETTYSGNIESLMQNLYANSELIN